MTDKLTSLKNKQPWTPGLRTYGGSCRCGAIRFEADLDLAQGTTQCNCTFCWTTQWWGVNAPPPTFRLIVSGPSHDPLESDAVQRRRCVQCGVVPFGHGNIPEIGGEFYAINVNCLDGVELEGVPVRYLDGLHDTWGTTSEAPYTNPFKGEGHTKPAW